MADSVLAHSLRLPRTLLPVAVSCRAKTFSLTPAQVFLLCAALSVVFQLLLNLRGFFSSTLDETGRTLDAYMWVTGRGSFVAVWLPFYRLVVGAAVWISQDLLVAPRIVTFLFGIATIAALVALAEEMFFDRTTTLLAGIVGAVLPERLILSAVPLAEIMFVFFVVTGMLGISRYTRSPERRHLVFAGAMFAISGAVRYEGWAFGSVLVLWYLYSALRRKQFRWPDAAGLAAMAGFFPACWLILNAHVYGNPLEFLSATTDRYLRIHGGGGSLLGDNVLSQFVLLNLVSGNILGILAVCPSRVINRRARAVLLVAGVTMLVLAVQMMTAKALPTHGFWRIAAVWSILLVPFSARVIAAGLAQRHRWLRGAALLALVTLLSLSLREAYVRTETSALSRDEVAAGEFLRQGLDRSPGGTVLIESVIWSYVNVMVASQSPERFHLNSGFDPLEHQPPFLRADIPLKQEQLRSEQIVFLVFRTDEYVDFLSDTKSVRLAARFGPWYVFEVSS